MQYELLGKQVLLQSVWDNSGFSCLKQKGSSSKPNHNDKKYISSILMENNNTITNDVSTFLPHNDINNNNTNKNNDNNNVNNYVTDDQDIIRDEVYRREEESFNYQLFLNTQNPSSLPLSTLLKAKSEIAQLIDCIDDQIEILSKRRSLLQKWVYSQNIIPKFQLLLDQEPVSVQYTSYSVKMWSIFYLF